MKKLFLVGLLVLGSASAEASVGCRPNSDGSWESYTVESGVSINAFGTQAACMASLEVTPSLPPPPLLSWVPAQPTIREYVDLYQQGGGPHSQLLCEEFNQEIGVWKCTTPWIKNEAACAIEFIVTTNAPGLLGTLASQVNSHMEWKKCETCEAERIDHPNIAVRANGTSESNTTKGRRFWPGQFVRAVLSIANIERLFLVKECD